MPRALLLCLALAASACASDAPEPVASPTGDPERWRSVADEPFPFVTPIPPVERTPVDGTYVRNVGSGSRPIPCRRCAPYRLDRGPATLRLDAGRFYVDQPESDFSSLGHFVVDGDEITLFNDAECPETHGTYRWSLEGDVISFEVVDDPCAFDLLRGRYLTAEPWERDDTS